jgi:hypothetical protein
MDKEDKKNTFKELSLFQKVKSQITSFSLDLATSEIIPLFVSAAFLAIALATPLFLWRGLLGQF